MRFPSNRMRPPAILPGGSRRPMIDAPVRDLPAPDLILYSEWSRTTETADIIAAAFSHASLRRESALIPGSGVAAVDSVLEALLSATNRPEHLVLVSHQPLVSSLIDYYLGDPGRVEPLSPGGLA